MKNQSTKQITDKLTIINRKNFMKKQGELLSSKGNKQSKRSKD